MSTTLSALTAAFDGTGLFLDRHGPDVHFDAIAPAEGCGPGDLVFVDRKEFVAHVQQRRPAAAVISSELEQKYGLELGVPRLVSTNVRLAHALVKQRYMDRDLRAEGWAGIHPGAIIHPEAVVGREPVIGPGAVIGKGARLGDRVVVMANVVIEDHAVIGDETVLHSGAIVGARCQLGARVVIKSGTVIGGEGYGYAKDADHRSHRIPHTGIVVLEDDVALGANCCVDRGTYGETRIKRGTKMDNLCHVAHNVIIGENCLLTAGFVVAGSTVIGDRVIASGQTGIIDHKKVADDVMLLHRSGVTEDITTPGAYAGIPVQPLQDYMKNTAVAKKLQDLRRTVRELEKRLEALESNKP